MQKKVPVSSDPRWSSLIEAQKHPGTGALMTQEWQQLLFAHARIEPDLVRAHLPEQLSLQTYDGSAWIGFVPFHMRNIRASGRRICGDFLETNLRTYVTHPEYGPGVWFFSLDANAFLPCLGARARFSLPYCYCGMMSTNTNGETGYYGTRADRQRLPSVFEHPARDFSYTAEFSVGSTQLQVAEPECFDFWLLERYRLFSAKRNGQLLTARVWHRPYEVVVPAVRTLEVNISDRRFEGLNFEHFRYCARVEVEAFRPVLV